MENDNFLEMPKTEVLPEETFLGIEDLMLKLVAEFKIVTALTFFNGRTWIRFSANIYNSREDYVKLRDRLAKALKIEIHQTSPKWFCFSYQNKDNLVTKTFQMFTSKYKTHRIYGRLRSIYIMLPILIEPLSWSNPGKAH